MAAKFSVGRLYITPAVRDRIPSALIRKFFRAHEAGDFGDICEEDVSANLEAIEHGGRILSAYDYQDRAVYVDTEADRSATTLMFAYEYVDPAQRAASASHAIVAAGVLS